MLSANQPLDITVQRGSQTFQKTLVPEPVRPLPRSGPRAGNRIRRSWWRTLKLVCRRRRRESRIGDEIVALDGKADARH